MAIPRGTWVEIILEGAHFSKRFQIGDSHFADALYDEKGNIIASDVLVYHAPFHFSVEGMPPMICCLREKDLRIINNDGERLSSLSFDNLMEALKAGNLSQLG